VGEAVSPGGEVLATREASSRRHLMPKRLGDAIGQANVRGRTPVVSTPRSSRPAPRPWSTWNRLGGRRRPIRRFPSCLLSRRHRERSAPRRCLWLAPSHPHRTALRPWSATLGRLGDRVTDWTCRPSSMPPTRPRGALLDGCHLAFSASVRGGPHMPVVATLASVRAPFATRGHAAGCGSVAGRVGRFLHPGCVDPVGVAHVLRWWYE